MGIKKGKIGIYLIIIFICSTISIITYSRELLSIKSAATIKSAEGLLDRMLPDHKGRFIFEEILNDNGMDVFEIETIKGKVFIRGNYGVSMAMGLNWYLRHYCHIDISVRANTSPQLPASLPMVNPKVRKTSWAQYRYFLNYCAFGYEMPFWDWRQWERFIDWMALNGINMTLAATGQEAVWQTVYKRLGLSDKEIDSYFTGPPFLPFQWMGCLDGYGSPLPKNWIQQHEDLQRKILKREREFGMKPVLQGFTGHVPDVLSKKFPQAKLHIIRWLDTWETRLADPLDPLFQRIADLFMEEQYKLYGTDHIYSSDTFIEMPPPSSDPVYIANLSKAVYQGMVKTDPDALWVLQGWLFVNNPNFWKELQAKALFAAVPNGRMLVLDLACENRPTWNNHDAMAGTDLAYGGQPWLWCNVQNYGRTVGLTGNLQEMANGLPAALSDPGADKLYGIGFVNESLGYNPVAFTLMYEMAWGDKRPLNLKQWISGYSFHRYRIENQSARQAWQLLLDVYNSQHEGSSALENPPSIRPMGDAVRHFYTPYDRAVVVKAWSKLLDTNQELRQSDAYSFDLVHVARQALVNHSTTIQNKIAAAFSSKDQEAFERESQKFLHLIQDIDELLATREEFLLGPWLEDAKRWGSTSKDRAKLEWNARRIITVWGETPVLRDYARKQWSGMLSGFYLPRWRQYLSAASEALKEDIPFDEQSVGQKIFQWELAWADQQEIYPSKPNGNSITVAQKLWNKYRDELEFQAGEY